MKLITFLGTAPYQTVTYFHGTQEYETKLFPVALCHFLQPAELIVLVTKEAGALWYAQLEKEVAPLVPVRVDIPDGHSVDDLWTIFERLTEQLAEHDNVVFDITYSFRTLPFLTFLAASYLRVAKNVTLEGIFYGAYEARHPFAKQPQPTDRAPVFDLTPFIRLLDWTTATDKFLKTGDAGELAALLHDTHASLQFKDAQSGAFPRELEDFANSLETVSQALALTRPQEVQPAAARLGVTLLRAEGEVERWAKPFTTLLDRTRQDYLPFAVPKERPLAEKLAAQWRLIDWYIEKRQIIQAVTLAREWVISLLCWKLGKNWLRERDIVEFGLNTYVRELRGKEAHERHSAGTALAVELRALPNAKALAELWSKLGDNRNDLAHCGMREKFTYASTLVERVVSLQTDLQQLAVSFHLPMEAK